MNISNVQSILILITMLIPVKGFDYELCDSVRNKYWFFYLYYNAWALIFLFYICINWFERETNKVATHLSFSV